MYRKGLKLCGNAPLTSRSISTKFRPIWSHLGGSSVPCTPWRTPLRAPIYRGPPVFCWKITFSGWKTCYQKAYREILKINIVLTNFSNNIVLRHSIYAWFLVSKQFLTISNPFFDIFSFKSGVKSHILGTILIEFWIKKSRKGVKKSDFRGEKIVFTKHEYPNHKI